MTDGYTDTNAPFDDAGLETRATSNYPRRFDYGIVLEGEIDLEMERSNTHDPRGVVA